MSAPMPPDLFVARVRARGVTVIEMTVDGKNWKNNNRNSVGPWSDVHGIVEHHTGSDTTNPYAYAQFLFRGSSALIGPLCQFGTAPNGDLYMVGWGRCNHAGGGDPVIRDMVRAGTIPLDREVKPTKGNSDGVDGNREFYGNEIMYSGGHPMTAAQLKTTMIVDQVIFEYHGWDAHSLIGHREWSDDKPDPGFQNMAIKRQMLMSGNGGDDVGQVDSFSQAAKEDLARYLFEQYQVPWVDPVTGKPDNPGHQNQSFRSLLSWNEEYTRRFAQEAKNEILLALKTAVNNGGVDLDALADDIVDKIAARLQN